MNFACISRQRCTSLGWEMHTRFGPVRARSRHRGLWSPWLCHVVLLAPSILLVMGGRVHGPWPGLLGCQIQAGDPWSGIRLAQPSQVLHWSTCWWHRGTTISWLVVRLLPSVVVSRRLTVSMVTVSSWWWLSSWGFKIVDVGATALEHGLHRWIYGERRGVVMISLFGHVDGEERARGDLVGGRSQIAF
jgi:hypothetical protein